MQVNLKINGREHIVDVPPDEFLLTTLRRLGYLGTRQGCDTSTCGVCTVHVDGKAVLSCTILTCRLDGHEITTIEGVEKEAEIIGKYLVAEGVEQCGYCSPGLIMSILYLEKCVQNPADTTDEEILHYLNGNLCRCSGYEGQLRAIKKYLEVKYGAGSK
ncbi:(2Fe-2S)-binding protein [Thermosyntropha sp.]|uniref:(2Fe-2S)-binding protein n=1 Tax=Thermosyntropha sp. TaxID=2740820 RepID=UPI0025CF6A85|nr:(2Fe-2S)-binding protein [Thermosyntropha sp.]MBO8159493.1 (2Fe-2S)-binding protein [Thermosyntropha sp.]